MGGLPTFLSTVDGASTVSTKRETTMATQIHEYPVTVEWHGGRDGSGHVTMDHSDTTVPLTVPVEFDGPGGASNPEELLTSAIASCYSITFGIIAANRKLTIESQHVHVVGMVEQNGAAFTFVKVIIRPHIIVPSTTTAEQLKLIEDMAHKADQYCIVTNALRGKVEVVVEPKIFNE